MEQRDKSPAGKEKKAGQSRFYLLALNPSLSLILRSQRRTENKTETKPNRSIEKDSKNQRSKPRSITKEHKVSKQYIPHTFRAVNDSSDPTV